jgi:hypothetical protein
VTGPNPFGAPKGNTAVATPPPTTGPKKAPAKKAGPRANAAPSAAAAEEDPTEEDAAPTTLTKAGPRKDPFALGKSGGGGDSDYAFKDFLGELLLVKPTEQDEMVTVASNGKMQPYVICDVYRLENPDADGNPEFVEDSYVFQTVLNKRFRKVLAGPNNWALGRLVLGVAKGSKNAPYLFEAPTDEEVDAAFKWATAQGLDL